MAFPRGHVLNEQSAPTKPSKQVHTPHVVHLPFAEHEFGQGVYFASVRVGGAARRTVKIKILENMKKDIETI